MNSSYWGKTVFKLLNLTKSVYNFSNNNSKTENSGIKAATIFIIFWKFLMFNQILLSPQVKRWAIITYKHGIHELCHELPNDLRLSILGN